MEEHTSPILMIFNIFYQVQYFESSHLYIQLSINFKFSFNENSKDENL